MINVITKELIAGEGEWRLISFTIFSYHSISTLKEQESRVLPLLYFLPFIVCSLC